MRSEVDRNRARTVADFMRDTFEAADPGKASESGLLARDLIDHGKRRLADLDAQKNVQAELALLLAESDANMGLLRESEATYAAYGQGIETLSAVDPRVRWRARMLALSNRMELEKDGPALDAALSELQRMADTPETHVQAARLQERLYVRRSEFGRAANTLESAWRRYGSRLKTATALRLRIDLGFALINAERNEDARRMAHSIDPADLDKYAPALQIHALRLIVRERQLHNDDRTSLVHAIGDWRRTAERLYGSDSLEAAKAYLASINMTADAAEQDALMHRAYAIQIEKLVPTSAARAHAEFNMGYFQHYLRRRPDLAEPHFAAAVSIGRAVYSRGHADVRWFELEWARTLNALGRYAVCMERLSSPPGDPEDSQDAEKLSNLRLALAKAAIALRRPADARREIAAVHALWRQLRQPLPADLTTALHQLEASLPPQAGRR